MTEPRTCSICGKNPAIVKVQLQPGQEVHWCGSCIEAAGKGKLRGRPARPVRARRSIR